MSEPNSYADLHKRLVRAQRQVNGENTEDRLWAVETALMEVLEHLMSEDDE